MTSVCASGILEERKAAEAEAQGNSPTSSEDESESSEGDKSEREAPAEPEAINNGEELGDSSKEGTVPEAPAAKAKSKDKVKGKGDGKKGKDSGKLMPKALLKAIDGLDSRMKSKWCLLEPATIKDLNEDMNQVRMVPNARLDVQWAIGYEGALLYDGFESTISQEILDSFAEFFKAESTGPACHKVGKFPVKFASCIKTRDWTRPSELLLREAFWAANEFLRHKVELEEVVHAKHREEFAKLFCPRYKAAKPLHQAVGRFS